MLVRAKRTDGMRCFTMSNVMPEKLASITSFDVKMVIHFAAVKSYREVVVPVLY